MKLVKKRLIVFVICVCCIFVLAGCASSSREPSGSSNGNKSNVPAKGAQKVRIGTLATEDILPCWVAQEENLYGAEGLNAQITVFQSASELIAAVSSKSVDFAMTDPMVAASLYASGANVQVQWVTLGADASQGRFGIMTSDPEVQSLAELANASVGVGSNTILEYVMDTLFERAGIPADQVKKEELQKLPVRYQAMASGQVKAAALPASLLALGEANGMVTVSDDTTGDNISQSVMISCETDAAKNALSGMTRAWNTAAERINAQPSAYRGVLASCAQLPESLAETYAMSTYPTAALPEQYMIDNVLNWMKGKEYLPANITYDGQTGCFQGR